MEQFNLDDNVGKLQEKLINHIDQEANKIIAELTRRMTRMTTKFKGEVNKRFTTIYAENTDLNTKKRTIAGIKNQVETNVKYLRRAFQMIDNEEISQSFRKDKETILSQNSLIPSSPNLHLQNNPLLPTIRRSFVQEKVNIVESCVVCSLCKRKFRNVMGLTRHQKMTHKSAVVCTYRCIHCKSLHTSSLHLAQHLLSAHGDVGYLDKRRRKFYVEQQSQQIFYEVEDLKEFIQKSQIYCGFSNEDTVDPTEPIDISDSELNDLL